MRDFSNAPQSNTWYPVATANKLANVDLSPASADIGASFSKTYSSWYFGTDAVTPASKINFVSVVLHELGHGLGFFGSMRLDNGSGSVECQGTAGEGCYGYSGFPVIYDRLTESGPGTPLLDFSNNSTELGDQLTSNAVYFDSPNANAANGGSRVPLYAPAFWSQGSSYSHLAESYNNTPHALMTYSISRGETIHNPGSVTLCMFNDMGWTVAAACGAAPITGLTATNNSPTVLGATTYLTATIGGGSNVSYEWDFGDGNGDTGAEVSHQYAAIGSYTAVVTATNSVGQASTSTLVQIVDVAISGLAAENDSPTPLGSSTHLTATIGGGSNVTYEWAFGDGSGDTGAEVSHQFAAPGNYTAVVTASNSAGQESTSTLVQVVVPTANLNLDLKSGWNMVSSYVDPDNPDMWEVFAHVLTDTVLVKNGGGEVFWPAFSINQIGDWNYREGYQVYMLADATLAISGTQVIPEQTPINLNGAWNLVAYLRNTPMSIVTGTATIDNEVLLVKNNQGQVYWPQFGIDQIGEMQPGQGYQMYLTQAGILTYPANE
jgi:PKD repeat protein